MSSNKIRKSGYWWKILISQISVSMNSNLFTAVIPKQPDELVPDWSNTSIIHCHLGTNLVARNLNLLHLQTRLLRFFSREMLCISAAYAVMRCPSVCAFVPHVRTFCRNGLTYLRFFSPSGSHTILVFQYQTAWQYADGNSPNGGLECSWGGISQSVNVATASCYQRDCRSLLELVLSTDGGPSSGVSQSRCKSVYGTESHAPVNASKREYNLIYAAENLTREYNWY